MIPVRAEAERNIKNAADQMSKGFLRIVKWQ